MAATATTTTTTTTTLSFIISVALIAGIVAGQNANRQTTNPTTEISESEDTTHFRYLKNETTGDHTIRKPSATYSTVQTTHFTTSEPKSVTFEREMSSKPKPVIKLRPRSSTTTTTTTTVKTTTVPNVTVSSNVANETDQTTNATTPGMIINNTTEETMNAIRKSETSNTTTTIGIVSSTQSNKPTGVTKPDPFKRFSLPGEKKPETTPISTEETTFFQKPENPTFSTEGRDMKKDFIEQELDDTINFMPKLPELVLSNETHFKFHQDSEEASLDERITQIARQLAETGLRREYEERKLGHFIPISVRPIEYVTPSYHSKSKSIKFVKSETQDFRPSHYKSNLLKVLTKTKSNPGMENVDKTAYELVTNPPEILRRNKSDKPIREQNGLIKVRGKRFNSDTADNTIPTNIPIFFELIQTSEKESSGPETKSEPRSAATTTTGKDLTTRGKRLTDDTTYYSYIETTDNS